MAILYFIFFRIRQQTRYPTPAGDELPHFMSASDQTQLVVFRNQLRFRSQPMLQIVTGFRSLIHIIVVRHFGDLVRRGCEILYGCHSGWSGELLALIRGVVFVFHPHILDRVVM